MSSKLTELFLMMRPPNSFMTGISVLLTYIMVNNYRVSDYIALLIGFATGYLVSAAAMLINDVVDIEVDKINKPWKPLPRGVFSTSFIIHISLLFIIISIVINIFVSISAFITVILFSFIACIYSFLRRYWWSHFLVSISTTAPFIYGYVLAGAPQDKVLLITLFSIVVFLINSAREFVKSIADYEGDKKIGYSTIATKYGKYYAAIVSMIFGIIGSFTAILIGVLGIASIHYLILLIIASILFIQANYRVLNKASRDTCIKAKKQMLIAMLIAIIGFSLAGL